MAGLVCVVSAFHLGEREQLESVTEGSRGLCPRQPPAHLLMPKESLSLCNIVVFVFLSHYFTLNIFMDFNCQFGRDVFFIHWVATK